MSQDFSKKELFKNRIIEIYEQMFSKFLNLLNLKPNSVILPKKISILKEENQAATYNEVFF